MGKSAGARALVVEDKEDSLCICTENPWRSLCWHLLLDERVTEESSSVSLLFC